MKKFLVALLVSLFLGSCATATEDNAITTIYLIRHAEKDRTEGVGKDPELTEAGHQRAQRWAEVLGLAPLDAVYSTNYKRTQQTAAPSAKANSLELIDYDPNAFDPAEFISSHKGKRVLIVGHSNTTPMLVNKFLKEERFTEIDDAVNGNLFVVTMVGQTVAVELLSIE